MKFVFAGDRDISVSVLRFLIEQGHNPSALWVSGPDKASHANELKKLVAGLNIPLFEGKEFEMEQALETMRQMDLDYVIGIHFPYIIRSNVLSIPKVGVLNLHPAYLPYNRGWHTPSWAIAQGTPAGATLHFMSEELDMGDIIARKEVTIEPYHTANSLYAALKEAEQTLFEESLPELLTLNPRRINQDPNVGTAHKSAELYKYEERDLDNAFTDSRRLIDILRAFTTNDANEAAYIVRGGQRYAVQVQLTKLRD